MTFQTLYQKGINYMLVLDVLNVVFGIIVIVIGLGLIQLTLFSPVVSSMVMLRLAKTPYLNVLKGFIVVLISTTLSEEVFWITSIVFLLGLTLICEHMRD